MGEGFKLGSGCLFKAFIVVTANPKATVTATGQHKGKIYTAVADEFGVANITVKKKDTYTVSTSAGVRKSIEVLKSGKTYTLSAVKVGSISGLSVAGWSSRTACVYWKNPSEYFDGVIVRYATGSAPGTTTSGTQAYSGKGGNLQLTTSNTVNGFTLSGLNAGTNYFFSLFPYYVFNGHTYYGEAQTISWAAKNYTINSASYTGNWSAGSVVEGGCALYGNGTFTIPEGVRSIDVFVVGGGGGGGADSGSGAGGGYTNMRTGISVIPGQTFSVSIGAGGKGGVSDYSSGSFKFTKATDGGTTSFGNFISAAGGKRGFSRSSKIDNNPAGGAGGSGGGAYQPSGVTGSKPNYAGNGGSDGKNGSNSSYVNYGGVGGSGQGKTTRAWGLPTGTLYSGGGGGGVGATNGANPGSGGAGGGGNGAHYQQNGSNATYYGGGGGGAGGGSQPRKPAIIGGNGYSGICLVRISG